MTERNIVPPVFTREACEDIKLHADFRTRSLLEAYETIVYAAAQHMRADTEVTRSRITVMRALAVVDLNG
jgi:hypothetical protein